MSSTAWACSLPASTWDTVQAVAGGLTRER